MTTASFPQLNASYANGDMVRCADTTIAPKCAVRRLHAGHAMHSVFVSDFDAGVAQIAERGLEGADFRSADLVACQQVACPADAGVQVGQEGVQRRPLRLDGGAEVEL